MHWKSKEHLFGRLEKLVRKIKYCLNQGGACPKTFEVISVALALNCSWMLLLQRLNCASLSSWSRENVVLSAFWVRQMAWHGQLVNLPPEEWWKNVLLEEKWSSIGCLSVPPKFSVQLILGSYKHLFPTHSGVREIGTITEVGNWKQLDKLCWVSRR